MIITINHPHASNTKNVNLNAKSRQGRKSTLVGLLALAFALPLLNSGPALAQLHGNWPGDDHWSTSDDRSVPHTERVATRASNSDLNIPRGDLRKDVSDASRAAPHGPQR